MPHSISIIRTFGISIPFCDAVKTVGLPALTNMVRITSAKNVMKTSRVVRELCVKIFKIIRHFSSFVFWVMRRAQAMLRELWAWHLFLGQRQWLVERLIGQLRQFGYRVIVEPPCTQEVSWLKMETGSCQSHSFVPVLERKHKAVSFHRNNMRNVHFPVVVNMLNAVTAFELNFFVVVIFHKFVVLYCLTLHKQNIRIPYNSQQLF